MELKFDKNETFIIDNQLGAGQLYVAINKAIDMIDSEYKEIYIFKTECSISDNSSIGFLPKKYSEKEKNILRPIYLSIQNTTKSRNIINKFKIMITPKYSKRILNKKIVILDNALFLNEEYKKFLDTLSKGNSKIIILN